MKSFKEYILESTEKIESILYPIISGNNYTIDKKDIKQIIKVLHTDKDINSNIHTAKSFLKSIEEENDIKISTLEYDETRLFQFDDGDTYPVGEVIYDSDLDCVVIFIEETFTDDSNLFEFTSSSAFKSHPNSLCLIKTGNSYIPIYKSLHKKDDYYYDSNYEYDV